MSTGSIDTGAKILVIDDEEDVRELLRDVVSAAGYAVRTAADDQEGLRVFYAWQPDLVLLDILMPKMDGWTMLERAREMTDVPVIMLTALGQEPSKVRALRHGADDYVAKPIGNQELLARIEAVLRRTKRTGDIDPAYRDRVLFVDFEHHRVAVRGQPIELSPTEFRLLTAMIKNVDIVMSSDRLLTLVWGDKLGGPGSVRVYVNYLRAKLEVDPGDPQLIETVRGFGYRYRRPQEAA